MSTTTPPPSAATTAAAAVFILLLSPAAVSAVVAQLSGGGDNPNKYQPTTITPSMAIIIVVLIFAVFFMGIFSIYVRHCSDDGAHSAGVRAAVGAAVSARSRRSHRGLPADVLLSFPTFPYNEVKSLRLSKTTLECAVCLYEFQDDEKLRLLPKCNHLFHSECIDAWLFSHSTCPVCRALLLPDDHLIAAAADGGGNEDTPSVVHLPREEEASPAGDAPARARLPRSHSTGHSLGRPPETEDRFTLRLPERVRAQLVNRGMNQVSFHTEASSRRGFHGAEGSSSFGSSRRRYKRLGRPERGTKSDRWLFTAAPPFFSRVQSPASMKAVEDGGEGSVSEGGRKTAVRTAACLVAPGGGGGGPVSAGGAGWPGSVRPPV